MATYVCPKCHKVYADVEAPMFEDKVPLPSGQPLTWTIRCECGEPTRKVGIRADGQ